MPAAHPQASNVATAAPNTGAATSNADSAASNVDAAASNADAANAAQPLSKGEIMMIDEQKRLEAESKAILDSLPKDKLYEQNSLSGWRMGIPDYGYAMDIDPMWQGLDNGEYDPPPPRPRPTITLRRGTMSRVPNVTHNHQQPAAMKAVVVDEQRPSIKSSGADQSAPSMKSSAAGQSAPLMRSSGEGHRAPTVPSMGFPSSQPSQSDRRQPNSPSQTMNPAWATIRGPSKYLQDAIAAKNAIPPHSGSVAVHHGRAQRAIGDGRAEGSLGNGRSQGAVRSGRGQDATGSDRAQDAIAAAARIDPRLLYEQPVRDDMTRAGYTYPQQPADRFRADNRPAIPRGAAPDRDARPYIGIPVFVKLAEANRERERVQAELEDREFERKYGMRAPSRSHYVTHGTHAFPLPFRRSTSAYDDGRQTGEPAYTTAPAPNGQVLSGGSFVPLTGRAVPELFRAARGADPFIRNNRGPATSPTVNPDNLSQRPSALRGSGSMPSKDTMPTQQDDGPKMNVVTAQKPSPPPV